MRARTLTALAVTAASLALAVPAAASDQCRGTYDTRCYTYTCSRTCLVLECAVWTDVVPGYQGGCIG